MNELVEYRETMQAFARVVAQTVSTVSVSILQLSAPQGKQKSDEQAKTEAQLADELAAIFKRELKYLPEEKIEVPGLQRELGLIFGEMTALILAEHARLAYLRKANHKRINLADIATRSTSVVVTEAARSSQAAAEIAAKILEFESTFTAKGTVLAAMVERYVKEHELQDASSLSGPPWCVRFGWITPKEVVIVFDYQNGTDFVYDAIGRLFNRTMSDLLNLERWGSKKVDQLQRESKEHQAWLREATARVFGDSAEWSDDFGALKLRKPLFS
jgi:hypothetical protein